MRNLEDLPDTALITTEEAARLLGVSPRLLREWRVQRRRLAFVKVGHAVRYEMGVVRQFIAAGKRRVA